MHHGQEAVEGHQNERVDARVTRHDDHVLNLLERERDRPKVIQLSRPSEAEGGRATHEFAPHVSERPFGQHVIGGREGNAENHEHDVGGGQVYDQKVRGRAHLLVGSDDFRGRTQNEIKNHHFPEGSFSQRTHSPKMTKAFPTRPARPMIPKKTGTTIETTRSIGQSVSTSRGSAVELGS